MTVRWYLKRGDRGTIDLHVEERAASRRGYVCRFDLGDVHGLQFRRHLRDGLKNLREVLAWETIRPSLPRTVFDAVEADG